MVKGQIISGDFMVSIAVFLIILTLILPLFVRFDEERRERFAMDDLQMKISFVSDYILKTPGYPADWNSSTITALGLANPDGRINLTRIRRMMKLGTQQSRDLLGLSGVEFNLSFYSNGYHLMTGVARSPAAYFSVNNIDIFEKINNSGIVWDYYYAGVSLPENDARFVYQGASAALFNIMLANSSAYKTIIIEDPGLVQAQVNINQLQNFVDRGGVVIFEGDADLISSGFSMSSGTVVDDGTVRDNSVIDASLGSTVDFSDPEWYFFSGSGDSPINIWIEHNSVGGGALAGYWNHGIGEVYFVTDADGTVEGRQLADSLNLVGRIAEYSTGSMLNIVTSSRSVVFDSRLNSLGLGVMVIGK